MDRLPLEKVFPADDPVARWVFVASHWLSDLWSIEMAADEKARAMSFDFLFFFRLLLGRLYEGERLVRSARRMPAVAEFMASLPPDAATAFNRFAAAFEGGDDSWAYQELKKARNLVSHYLQPDSNELGAALREFGSEPVTFVVDHRVDRVRFLTADEIVMAASFGGADARTRALELMPVAAALREAALASLFPAQEHYFASRGIERAQVVLRIPND